MSDGKSYKSYFNIDPKYYAAVTEDLIRRGDVKWEAFYPHESFVKLLEKTEAMLSKSAHGSLWVEGAYGTGKSHAVLTLKSLLEAPEEKVRAYFTDYGLKPELCEKFLADRKAEKLLTVHRIGSASIRSDQDLILAVQDSITAALQSRNIEKRGDDSLREAALKWLEASEANREYFQKLILDQNSAVWDFGIKDIDKIIKFLKSDDPDLVGSLMRSILKVARNAGILALRMDADDMAAWIKSIIDENGLSAIVFIWDEFTEYFNNNQNSLTGFQTLVEISSSHPFYFVIVTHESGSLIKNDGDTRKKIMDRFVGRQPVAIDLPDNMAFRLMAQAMKKTTDSNLLGEWDEFKSELIGNLENVRGRILKDVKKNSTLGAKTQLSEKDLNDIVPIHPYAALMLKHMSVLFNSNARSMFDFIISNDKEDTKNFKWFINNYGPLDECNLLTVDMLWDFFNARNQSGLDDSVRAIFDSLGQMKTEVLARFPDHLRVFKTVALLEAVSQKVSGVELLLPTDENIELAFSGTDWNIGKAKAIAASLASPKMGILFKGAKLNGKDVYSVIVNTRNDEKEIEKLKDDLRHKLKTSDLIVNGNLDSAVQLPAPIAGRFDLSLAYVDNFTLTANKCRQAAKANQFRAVLAFSKDDDEAARLEKLVLETAGKFDGDFLFIESLSSMGHDLFERYIDRLARSRYFTGKDNSRARVYENEATNVLSEWRQNVTAGAFKFYSYEKKSGVRCANREALFDELRELDRLAYPLGLEHFSVTDGLFVRSQVTVGAECGIKQELKNLYKSSNPRSSLETALEGAWHVENYWKDSGKAGQPIVRIKKYVEEFIAENLQKDSGRVSILEIFRSLQERPYGFMLNNLSAFAMGFLLKEYANSDYFWSNGSQSEPMSAEKMKNAIKSAFDEAATPNMKFKEEFIVAMSPEMRKFLNCTASVFGISGNDCNSIEGARRQIRLKMMGFSFPIWTLKFILNSPDLSIYKDKIAQVIDHYSGIANTANAGTKSESEHAEQIGKIVKDCPILVDILKSLFTSANCRKGMFEYIGGYRKGILRSLAGEIVDGGAYLDRLKERFSADGNWVWSQETANEKIDALILEYQIIAETNKFFTRCSDLDSAVREWNGRTDNFKMPIGLLQKDHDDLKPLLVILYHMKQSGQLQEHERLNFYKALVEHGKSFDEFYKNQLEIFKKACGVFLEGLDDEDIRAFYNGWLATGQFVKDQREYDNYLNGRVEEYRKTQKRNQLRELWKAKTDTKNPFDWSDRYRTPILCMFDDTERAEIKKIFAAFFNGSSDREVEAAISYLEKGNFYERLASAEERDKCFMRRIVRKYDVMLPDADSVRKEIFGAVQDKIYDWMDNSSVLNKLESMARKQYRLDGCTRAKSLLDSMDAAQLREYMNRMLEDNLDVGMEILKKGKA